MKVQCISRIFTAEQRISRGAVDEGEFVYFLQLGKEYQVVSVTVYTQPSTFGIGTVYEVIDDNDRLMPVPSCLFNITDPTCSAIWQCQISASGSFRAWPRQFLLPYFHDRLSDGEPDALLELSDALSELDREDTHRRSSVMQMEANLK